MSEGCLRLLPAARKQYTSLSQHRVIHAIAKNLAVAKISGSNTVNPNRDLRLGAGVSQLCQPLPKQIFAGGSDLALNFDHSFSVTYKLQRQKKRRLTPPVPRPHPTPMPTEN
jgi:hypothetical protein